MEYCTPNSSQLLLQQLKNYYNSERTLQVVQLSFYFVLRDYCAMHLMHCQNREKS